MDPLGAPKTTFMLNHGNYYYNFMLFDLKNAGATYHWLMNPVLTHHIGEHLEVHVDDMIVKTIKGCSHAEDFEDVM